MQLKGKYQTGIASIQCMYAPEFNSHSESFEMEVRVGRMGRWPDHAVYGISDWAGDRAVLNVASRSCYQLPLRMGLSPEQRSESWH